MDGNVKKRSSQDDKKIIEEALERFKICEELESDNRPRFKEALAFYGLEQWDPEIKRNREGDKESPRPCLVMDKTRQHVKKVINDIRNNPPSMKARPVDDQADVEVAKVYDGLFRHIQDASNASEAYINAGKYAAIGGWGYWRVITEYSDPRSFDQDVRIMRVSNTFSVYLGPHLEPTGCDAPYGFVFEDMSREDFKNKYPNAKEVDFHSTDKASNGWSTKETIRVGEYYCKKNRTVTIVQMEDGQIMEQSEHDKNTKAAQAANLMLPPEAQIPIPQIINTRSTTLTEIKWYKLTAEDVLMETTWPGEKYIPIVKVVGDELVMDDGEIVLNGMVYPAMDAQRLHNYSHSAFAEKVALAPKAPWVGAVGQFKTKAHDWKTANRRNIAVLEYDTVDVNGIAVSPPQRQIGSQIESGWQQIMLNTEHGVEAALGSYGASVGGPSRERSGIALREQKQQGEIGNLDYSANVAQGVTQTARILLEVIPKIYDTPRIARILGEDDSIDLAHLDPEQEQAVMPMMDAFGEETGKSYNLNVGKYDVVVTTGPTFSTRRQEGAELMQQSLQGNPEMMALIGDLFYKILDVPYADKIAERLKAMLPPPLQQLEQQKDKKPVDPRVTAAMAQAEQAMQMVQEKGMELQQAQAELDKLSLKVSGEQQSLDSDAATLEANRKVFEANVSRAKAELKLAEIQSLTQLEEKQRTEGDAMNRQDAEIIREAILQIGEMTARTTQEAAQTSQAVAETVGQALQAVAEAHNRPRTVRDAEGNVIGSSG